MVSPKILQLSKWLKCGMVLASKQQQTILHDLLSKQLPCGASTGIDGNEANTIFSEVVNHLENVGARRQMVLRKFKVKEKDTQMRTYIHHW